MDLFKQIASRLLSVPCAIWGFFTAPFRNMDGLELNKIAAAVLLAGIIVMVSGKVAGILYHGGGHGHGAEMERGYTIAGAEEGITTTGPVEAGPVDIALFLAKADVAKGEAITKACLTCHSFEKGGPNKVGPNLYGIVGAKMAHSAGFAYSKALAEKGGQWDFQSLSEFLTKPAKYLPGTKMAYAGIKDDQQRADLIAWLNQNSDSALPLPEPKAAEPAAQTDLPTSVDGEAAAAGAAPAENASPETAKPGTPAAEGVGKPVPGQTGAGTGTNAVEAQEEGKNAPGIPNVTKEQP